MTAKILFPAYLAKGPALKFLANRNKYLRMDINLSFTISSVEHDAQ
jgi:hypothetical protein